MLLASKSDDKGTKGSKRGMNSPSIIRRVFFALRVRIEAVPMNLIDW
jgi:hypothetical protein